MNTKKRNIILFTIMIYLIISAIFAAEKVSSKVIATIGNDSILASDLNEILIPIIEQYKKINPEVLQGDGLKKIKSNIIEQMIDEKLLLQEAKRQKIVASKRKQDLALQEFKKRFKSDEDFKKEMVAAGFSDQKLKEKISNQVVLMDLIDKEVKSKVKVPSDEILKKYYQDNESKMIEPETVKIRHILIKTTGASENTAFNKIKDLKVKLDNKMDFSEVAKKYSEDKVTAERGGDVGVFTHGQMVKEFEDAAFKLNVNEISPIIKTKYGYHILKCDGKTSSQKKTFDEVKDYLKQFLYQAEIEKSLKQLIETLKSKTNISIKEN